MKNNENQQWQFTPYEEPKPDILLGDLYKDNKLSVMDLIVLQRHLVNLDTISEAQFPYADMNADGNVDIFDLALLKHAVLAQKSAIDSAKAAEQIGLTG